MTKKLVNPVIAEVFRGGTVESQHRGAFVLGNGQGNVVHSAGNISEPIFPRSAIKAFQCLPLIESGAANHFGFNDEEIAICCSSHGGEPEHLRVARSILAKAEIDEACYECGAHMPTARDAMYQLVRNGETPKQVHNNCSGKHADMLALAKHLGASLDGYVRPEHPVQRAVAECFGRYCETDLDRAAMGTDGCSVPTWAVPLERIAMAFARLADPANAAGQWIIHAARAHPFLIAGTGRFDTKIMQAVPRLFTKGGAEGVACGCIPHAQLGFALKCEDGTARGAEVAVAQMLARLDVWDASEKAALDGFARQHLTNWRKLDVGDVVATAPA